MARLRTLPVTIDTVPTSILILDQLTMDEAQRFSPIGEQELPGIPKILAFPFDVDLADTDQHNCESNVDLSVDAAIRREAGEELRPASRARRDITRR